MISIPLFIEKFHSVAVTTISYKQILNMKVNNKAMRGHLVKQSETAQALLYIFI